MLIRLLALTALVLPMGWSADAVAPAKLSEDAITAKLQETQKSLQALHLQQGQSVAPEKVQQQMGELDAMIEQAADPLGEAAIGARLMRSQVFQVTGQGDKCEAELRSVIAGGGAPKGLAGAYYLLAMQYSQADGKEAEIVKLAEDAEKAKIDPEVLGALQGMAKQAAIAPGKPFPDFSFTDLAGAQHALSEFRGKVLLVDFWATWCGPCVGELPNVKAAYEAYHAKGFEIVGISLDKDRAKLDAFLKDKGIPWTQSFDGKGWENAIAMQFGIHSIPATFLIDSEGKLIAKDVRGEELKAAVKKAVEATPALSK